MQSGPKVSVIIPVYNVEPYLRQCLDSVVNQTYRDLEIILVDDGSPDNCGTICDEYAAKDERVTVVHKQNGGVSAARNDALKLASGEWISFVDPDDWCELDLYEKAIPKALESDADIVLFSIFKQTGKNKEERLHTFDREFETSDRQFIAKLQAAALGRSLVPLSKEKRHGQDAPWDKLFKASFIFENGLTYAENVKAHEDIIFNVNAFQFAQKVCFFDMPLYHWRANPASIGHKYTPDRVQINMAIYEELFSIGKKYDLPDEYYQALNVFIIDTTLVLGKICFFNKKREGTIFSKMKYANDVLHTEPFYSAFENVKREKLGKSGKVITITRHNNILLLYLVTQLRRLLVGI